MSVRVLYHESRNFNSKTDLSPHCSKVAAATPDIKLATVCEGGKGNVFLFIREKHLTELHQQMSPQVHWPTITGSHANALVTGKLGMYLSDIAASEMKISFACRKKNMRK